MNADVTIHPQTKLETTCSREVTHFDGSRTDQGCRSVLNFTATDQEFKQNVTQD